MYYAITSKELNGNGWNLNAATTKIKWWNSFNDSGAKAKDQMNEWLQQNGNVKVQDVFTKQLNRSEQGGYYIYWVYVVYTHN